MRTENKDLARALRHESTWAEKSLWRKLRDRKLMGLKFHRQQPFGTYILDFYCPDKDLVVELDGGQHDLPGTREYDSWRTEYLKARGLDVLRFWNSQIRENLPWVLETIRRKAGVSAEEESESPHLNPLPQGERKEVGATDVLPSLRGRMKAGAHSTLSLEGRGWG